MTKKEKLLKDFENIHGFKYMALIVKMPGLYEPEIIINRAINFKKKAEFYSAVYDDDLNHVHSAGVSIETIYLFNSLDALKLIESQTFKQ